MKIFKIFMYTLLAICTDAKAFELVGVTFLDTNLSINLSSKNIVLARGYDTVETYGRSEMEIRRLERQSKQIRSDELLRAKRDSYNRRRYERLRRDLGEIDPWGDYYRKPRRTRKYYDELAW